jgi:hypothetical protein
MSSPRHSAVCPNEVGTDRQLSIAVKFSDRRQSDAFETLAELDFPEPQRLLLAVRVNSPQRPLAATGAALPFQSKCNSQRQVLAELGLLPLV